MRASAALALVLLIGAAPAFAAKPPTDFGAVSARAQAGDPSAEIQLGRMYENGKGVARDETQAQQWFQKAADQGDPEGDLALGELYFKPRGIGRDFDMAQKYFEAAAQQGLAQAQYKLGAMYAYGEGTRFQDFSKAAEWLTRAANQNHALAQLELGDLYFNGQGVGQSAEDAYVWYMLAGAHKLNKKEQKRLQMQLDRVRQLLSETQLESAQSRVRAWKPVMESKTSVGRKTP